jgi:murein DD-endopeptidase MepM/ murein hydrolase activator NlpD
MVSTRHKVHVVRKGETLYSIAKAFGVSVDILRSENKLSPSSLLKAGDLLRIPLGGKAQATAAPAAGAAPADPKPAMPDAVKTSVKTVAKSVSWPCSGEVRYLDGKAYGVVIRSKQGESQKALTAGKVSIAGPYRGYGNVVFVLSQGFVYVYGGNDAISVRVGDRVKAGQEIGKVGIDGKLGGPAAYFFVYRNGEAIDPATAPRD